MDHALEWLGFTSIEQLTAETLKKQFKQAMIQNHPDRGGSEDGFDETVRVYEYLSAVLKRSSGGRDGSHVLDVSDIMKHREEQCMNELHILMNEVFDEMERQPLTEFLRVFNEEFEKQNEDAFQSHGYGSWLVDGFDGISIEQKSESKPHRVEIEKGLEWASSRMNQLEEDLQQEIKKREEMDLALAMEQLELKEDLHQVFVETVLQGKEPSSAVILYPQQMALLDQSVGMELIPRDPLHYGSDPYMNPEYSDLRAAYTSEHVVLDKLPREIPVVRTLDELLLERDHVYDPCNDQEMEAIAQYEKYTAEREEEIKEKSKIYFTDKGSSYWALSNKKIHTDPISTENK